MLTNLRLLGALIGLTILFISVARYQNGGFRRLDLLIGLSISAALFLIALSPDTFNYVLGWFSFQQGSGGRIIGLLVISNFILYILLMQITGRLGGLERDMRTLVRSLAQQRFREEFDSGEEENEGKYPIQVIIPAFNEEDNIRDVINRIPKNIHGREVGIIVSVDGATDATEKVVRGLKIPTVALSINQGGGSALRAGYDLALEKEAEIVVTIDADGQHQPEEIPDLVLPILQDEADLVNGSRMLGEFERDSTIRYIGIIFFNVLVSVLTLQKITDCSNAFRAVRSHLLRDIQLEQAQFHTSELLIEAIKHGYRVKEVPITILKRQSGESKKPPSLKYGWGFTKAIFKTWLR